MENKILRIKEEVTTVRLHLELKNEYLSDYHKRMLKRYGESTSGESITRDILIPSDMPLHNLHYTIQKLFGWENSHMRRFYLPEETYNKLTGGTVKGWSDLVGILFQPPSEIHGDIFWDDDYEKGSIKTWLKKKYTGPYVYGGTIENLEVAKEDINSFLYHFEVINVKEPFEQYMERSKKEKDTEIRIIKKAPLIKLTIEEMNSSIILESGTESLMEKLEVNKVIASQDEDMDSKDVFPVTKKLIYNYDFGDDWIVTISKHKDCEDLLNQNIIARYELEEAESIVLNKHKPVCISKDGISLLDDVGGLYGFADFLGVLYEGEDKEEKASARAWAKAGGWSDKKISNKAML